MEKCMTSSISVSTSSKKWTIIVASDEQIIEQPNRWEWNTLVTHTKFHIILSRIRFYWCLHATSLADQWSEQIQFKTDLSDHRKFTLYKSWWKKQFNNKWRAIPNIFNTNDFTFFILNLSIWYFSITLWIRKIIIKRSISVNEYFFCFEFDLFINSLIIGKREIINQKKRNHQLIFNCW